MKSDKNVKRVMNEIRNIEWKYGYEVFMLGFIHMTEVGTIQYTEEFVKEQLYLLENTDVGKLPGIFLFLHPDKFIGMLKCGYELSRFNPHLILHYFKFIHEHDLKAVTKRLCNEKMPSGRKY